MDLDNPFGSDLVSSMKTNSDLDLLGYLGHHDEITGVDHDQHTSEASDSKIDLPEQTEATR